MNNERYLNATDILDYRHPLIQALIAERNWQSLSPYERVGAVYNFVRNEITFGYNRSDNLPASAVLKDGYGQCNTKSTLVMALFRALGIPCRFHGFTIYNDLQKGAIPVSLFWLAPRKILHSWVEVLWQGEWLDLEGFILDDRYLSAVQGKFADRNGAFSGYGIATPCLQKPGVEWSGSNTYIQKDGIADDLGVYDAPDGFYRERGTNLSGIRRFIFRHLFRHVMNANVKRIRRQADSQPENRTRPNGGHPSA